MIIFLVGYMGCGKTKVGKQLAEFMSYKFIDLDDFIEKSEKRSITQIFNREGEAGFRGTENKHLHFLENYTDIVVSTGGGTPCFYDNMAFMNKHGITVYLNMDVRSLSYRLQHGKEHRPLIQGKSQDELLSFISQHLAERQEYYEESEIIVNAMGFDDKKCKLLIQKINNL